MAMEKSAQGIVQDAEQPTTDLRSGVAQSLGVSPKAVNPEDRSPLENIKKKIGDAVHLTETTFGETIGTEVNYPRSNKAIEWMEEKIRRQKKQTQSLEKAA